MGLPARRRARGRRAGRGRAPAPSGPIRGNKLKDATQPTAARRVRVLNVITSMAGGAGFYVYQLARRLDPERFDVRIAFGPGYPLDAALEKEGIPHYVLGWSRRLDPLAIVKGARELHAILRRERFDIVHVHCSLAGVVGRLLARRTGGARVIFTVHALASRDYQPAWRKALYLAVERFMDRFTDRYVITTRRYAEAVVARRITRWEKITILPLALPVEPPPTPAARAAARRTLGLEDDALAVLAAGRLEPQKGFAYLIRAFAEVRRRNPRARLFIAGDGPLRADLEGLVATLGLNDAVRLLGARDDLRALMAGADLYCLSSLWESFGYVLLEAMIAGLPLVVTAVDGVPEVVDDGRCAALVPPADAPALAAAICDLLDDPARRAALARAGRLRVEQCYDEKCIMAAFERFYLEQAGRADDGAAVAAAGGDDDGAR